jgi:hypothetical protein
VSLGQQSIDNMCSNEPGTAGDKDFHSDFVTTWCSV